ncbi:hypothetical protein U9M48_044418 [Paspalum notatum var. saurae]|uniref:Uncharacterized protein n=1 Tax=Paspalum notatum var. saurae TaxID=547442 RepID=A0AAQ3UX06_PASNO
MDDLLAPYIYWDDAPGSCSRFLRVHAWQPPRSHHMELTLLLVLSLRLCLLVPRRRRGRASSTPPAVHLYVCLRGLVHGHRQLRRHGLMAAAVAAPVWNDKPPYGMTFFGRPTGRTRDGRCLRAVNAVARHHNALLRAAVGRLRARIVFADFYTPVYTILQNPARFGGVIGGGEALKACCTRHRRRLQLERQRGVRHAGSGGVREPVGVRDLGRGALHGERQPLRRHGVALRALRRSAHRSDAALARLPRQNRH